MSSGKKRDSYQRALDLIRENMKSTSPTSTNIRMETTNWQTLKILVLLMNKYLLFTLLAIVFVFVASAIDGFLIYRIRFIVDNGDSNILTAGPLTDFAKMLIVLMITRALLQFSSQYIMQATQNRFNVNLSEKMFLQVARMPKSFFDIQDRGEVQSKLLGQLSGVTGSINTVLLMLSREGSTVLSFLIVMFHTNWALSSIILVMIPVLALTSKFVSRTIKAITRSNLNTGQKQLTMVNELISGQQVVSLYNAVDFEHKKYYGAIDNVRRNTEKGVIANNLGQVLVQVISAIILAVIIYMAAYANDLGIPPVTPGEFIVIFTSMFSIFKPIRSLQNVQQTIVGTLETSKTVLPYLALDIEEDNGTKGEEVNFAGEIKYENVTFSYPSRPKDIILENFNLTIEAGKTYAFVGKSGSGKSTIINLLPRVYNPNSGKITISGVDTQEIRLKDLRDHISVVSQNIHLFDDTIYNNIIYSDVDKYTKEEVYEAARLAHVTDFADKLEKGLETVIGAEGSKLSGGQKQRVAIARALLRKKPILILDEATSALDNESEFFIQNSLAKLQEGKTVLTIAHRLSTIENADQILVMRQGKIIEQGTHKELIQQPDSEYFKLYTKKFDEGEDDEEEVLPKSNSKPDLADAKLAAKEVSPAQASKTEPAASSL